MSRMEQLGFYRPALLACAMLFAGLAAGCGGWGPQTRTVSKSRKIAAGEVSIAAGQAVDYRIEIQEGMDETTLSGTFTASGGTGINVPAAVADPINYANWTNGHQATVLWQTAGQQSAGRFELKLSPGSYVFGISNKFSTFSDKKVVLDVDLKYRQKE